MSKLARGKCPTCEQLVALRRGDLTREHQHAGKKCSGSGSKAVPEASEVVRRGELALQELLRSVSTAADKERVQVAIAGLTALDIAQAELRMDIEDICFEHTDPEIANQAASDAVNEIVREIRQRISSAVGGA